MLDPDRPILFVIYSNDCKAREVCLSADEVKNERNEAPKQDFGVVIIPEKIRQTGDELSAEERLTGRICKDFNQVTEAGVTFVLVTLVEPFEAQNFCPDLAILHLIWVEFWLLPNLVSGFYFWRHWRPVCHNVARFARLPAKVLNTSCIVRLCKWVVKELSSNGS